jgi:hypothetical protein
MHCTLHKYCQLQSIVALFYSQNKSWLHLATSKFSKRLSPSPGRLSEVIKPAALNAFSVLADVAVIIWCFRWSWLQLWEKRFGVLPKRDVVWRSGWVCLELLVKLPHLLLLLSCWQSEKVETWYNINAWKRYMKIRLFETFPWERTFCTNLLVFN